MVAELTARFGQRVVVEDLGVSDRRGLLQLDPPGLTSPNRACRLIRAADGWIAINLAREEDQELVPAWLRCDPPADLDQAIDEVARTRGAAELLEDGAMLGLPIARVGEAVGDDPAPPQIAMGQPRDGRPTGPLRVVDLSALWAGPMCGAILAAMGAAVTKIESISRPDPTRTTTPDFFRRLNGRKAELRVDLTSAGGQAQLWDAVLAADVFITSARPRAFAPLGLDSAEVFAATPGLTWVAITGHGWTGEGAARVAFGDDAAAAGGLVRWLPDGTPNFLGDALSDPVTGLGAAIGALQGVAAGGGVLVDVAMARCAASAASICGIARAP
jgi:hypothetical protein